MLAQPQNSDILGIGFETVVKTKDNLDRVVDRGRRWNFCDLAGHCSVGPGMATRQGAGKSTVGLQRAKRAPFRV